jgi:1,4-alpha-glucan branching enzyme
MIGCYGSRAFKTGPIPVNAGIRFQLFYPDAETISITGTFNNWDPKIHFLSETKPGYWSIVIPLSKGRYQYMFVVDQQIWISDPGAEIWIDDGFGQKNSLLVVE